MNYPMLTALSFILLGLLCIYLFNKKTLPKEKIYWRPQLNPDVPLPQLKPEKTGLMNESMQLGLIANRIDHNYPFLDQFKEQIRELQGCLYLMNQYLTQGTRTLEQIKDYETYLLKKYYETQNQPLDIPTNNSYKI